MGLEHTVRISHRNQLWKTAIVTHMEKMTDPMGSGHNDCHGNWAVECVVAIATAWQQGIRVLSHWAGQMLRINGTQQHEDLHGENVGYGPPTTVLEGHQMSTYVRRYHCVYHVKRQTVPTPPFHTGISIVLLCILKTRLTTSNLWPMS